MKMMLILVSIVVVLIVLFLPLRIRVLVNHDLSLMIKVPIMKKDILINNEYLERRMLINSISSLTHPINSYLQLKLLLNFLFSEFDVLKKVFKIITLEKVTFLPKVKPDNMYISFSGWMVNIMIKNLIDGYFKTSKNEYFQVMLKDDVKQTITFDCTFRVRIYQVIYILLRYFKIWLKAYKIFYQRRRKYES
jgi:hypothetical protein